MSMVTAIAVIVLQNTIQYEKGSLSHASNSNAIYVFCSVMLCHGWMRLSVASTLYYNAS